MDSPLTGLREFWRLVAEVWRDGAFGIDIGLLVVAIAIFAVFLVLRGLFTRFVILRLKAWTKKTATEIDDHVIAVVEKPLRFVPIVLGFYFAVDALALHGTFEQLADKITRSLIAYNIFWLFYRLVGPLSFLLKGLETVFSRAMTDWLVKAI